METQLLNTTKVTASLKRSMSNYARMGIDIEILENKDNLATVKISQKRLLNGYILNQKQLVERAKEVFEPTGLKINVIPLVFSLDVDTISSEWITNKMAEFNIKRKGN